jgi:hypothetical protein
MQHGHMNVKYLKQWHYIYSYVVNQQIQTDKVCFIIH